MRSEEKDQLLDAIEYLRQEPQGLKYRDVEHLLMKVLQPLLVEDGYEVQRATSSAYEGIDFWANLPPSEQHQGQTLGIEFKYYQSGSAIGVNQVRQLIGAAMQHQLDRVILLSNTRFSKAARDLARHRMPFEIELVDFDSLQAWTARLAVDQEGLSAEIKTILRIVSCKFARLIAENPHVLDELEWRDVERTIAEVFEGLGFSTRLTPPSKDGGKDVVLECIVEGQRTQYIVEIKALASWQ